jgi:hypothetical protein
MTHYTVLYYGGGKVLDAAVVSSGNASAGISEVL